MSALLQAALHYAAVGIPVLPLHTPTPHGCSCGHRDCDHPGKHPRWHPQLITNGLHQATTDTDTIHQWWAYWPQANVGLRTGVVADVCDIDSQEGVWALRNLLQGQTVTGPAVRTGSGGWHLYVAATGQGNRVGVLPGVDWRGRNGYVVAPPSAHAAGRHYTWDRPLCTPLPDCPPPLLALLTPPTPAAPTDTRPVRDPAGYGQTALAAEVDRVRTAPAPRGVGPCRVPGGRNAALNKAAFNLGQLVAAGLLDEAQVVAALTDAALNAGLGPHETARTIRSGLRAGQNHPRRPATQPRNPRYRRGGL